MALAHRTAAVETALGQLQHHAQAFLLHQDKQYRERFEATYATLRTDLDVLTGLAQRSGNTTLTDNVATIAHYGVTYADTFQQVVAAWDKRGLDPRAGLQGAFRKATHALATTLVHADVDDLYHELLLLRHWEQEVARNNDAPATQHLLATLARYQALLDQGPYAAHVKHAQQTALAGYAEALRTSLAPTTPSPSKAQAYANMHDLTDALQETLEQVRIPESLALAVQLRSEEKHYWRRRAPQDIEGIHRALAALHNRVHSAPVAPAWAATIVGRLAQYHQHFEALVAIDGEVTVLTEAMRETMHQVSPLVPGIKAANRAAMRARARAISHAATRRAAGDLGLGMIVVLIGCLVGWTLRLRMIRPVQQRANVATQLTAGI